MMVSNNPLKFQKWWQKATKKDYIKSKFVAVHRRIPQLQRHFEDSANW